MLQSIKKTIKKFKMLSRGDRIVVAVSGGVDSAVLLHVLNELSREFGLTLFVCHLNHNLRARESMRDFNFVKGLAKGIGLPFLGKKLKKDELKKMAGSEGRSLQDASREKRLEFLDEAARRFKADRVALGHNLDDQAETVLMRFVKGSGLKGLAGMAPVRGKFIRPLIEVSRAEIERFARENKINFVRDSSNLDTRYLRNRIRLRLIPFIRKNLNPNIIENLARTAGILAGDDEYLRSRAEKAFPQIVKKRTRRSLVLDRKKLLKLDEALSKRVFLAAVEEIKGKTSDIYALHIESFLKALGSTRPNASFNLPDGLCLFREYDNIILSTIKRKKPKEFEVKLKVPGRIEVKGAGLSISARVMSSRPVLKGPESNAAYFDYDLLPRSLKVRTFRPGDRIKPLGMKGHKKLKDIFIEKKIPLARRRTIPILCAGEEVLWVVNVRQSDKFKIEKKTKRILKVECKTGGNFL